MTDSARLANDLEALNFKAKAVLSTYGVGAVQ